MTDGARSSLVAANDRVFGIGGPARMMLIFGFVLVFMFAISVTAQEIIPLYPVGKMPNSKGMELKQEMREERIYETGPPVVRAYLPPATKNAGAALLIIPGGGYGRIAYQNARTNVANWLNSIGIAAFALDYRLPTSPDLIKKEIGPLQDAQRAMRLIRSNAKKWNINPEKVGVMGTSAGGHAATFIATTMDDLDKVGDDVDKLPFTPNFVILASPVITMGEFAHGGSKRNLLGEKPSSELIEKYSTERHVSAKTPPTFIFLASDDQSVSPKNSTAFYAALLDKKVSATLHIFPTGGHSIPVQNGPGSSSLWAKLCELWLVEMKFIPAVTSK